MSAPDIRHLTPALRWVYWAGCAFVLIASVQLFLLSADTDAFFAWTIRPPLTAAVLGGFYWTALVVAAMSARAGSWAAGRVGLLGIFLFLVLTLAATLLHLDRFHLHDARLQARLAAWVWLIVYIADPIAVAIAAAIQLREPGGDPVEGDALPGWYRAMLLAFGSLLTLAGIALLFAPAGLASEWAWQLTPLTARVLGAWVVGMGVMLVQAAWEDNWQRIRPATVGLVVFGILQAVALARYAGDVRWDQPISWLLLLVLLSAFLAGVYGTRAARTKEQRLAPLA